MGRKYRVIFEYNGDEEILYDGYDFSMAYQILSYNFELNPVIEEYETIKLFAVK